MAHPPLVLLAFPLLACLALPAAAQKAPEIRVATGRGTGAASAAGPAIATGNGTVHVAYVDDRTGAGDVWCNSSFDNGATWLAADVRLPNRPAAAGTAFQPRLVASRSSPTVVAAWLDTRHGGTDVFCRTSLDGGLTWQAPDVRLDASAAVGTGACADVRIAMSGSSVYVVWTDARSGTGTDVRANVSHDSGATWLAADVVLNGTPGTAANPDVAAADPFVHVAWNDTRNGLADVYCTHSANSGASWLPEARLNLGVAAGTAPGTGAPRLAIAQQHVLAAWTDARNATTTGTTGDVFCIASHDSGTTWAANDTRLDAAAGSPPPGGCADVRLATTGTTVFVAWSDGRTNAANHDVYVNSSTDGGASWRGDVRVDTGDAAGAADSNSPALVAAGSLVQVAWADRRDNGVPHLYSNRSVDGGLTWPAASIRLDPGAPTAGNGALQPVLALANASVHAAWTDDRTSPFAATEVFYNLANGYQPYGTGTPGQFGGIPILAGSGAMAIGGTASINVSNGRGGAAGVLVIGLGPAAQVSVPLLGGTLLVAPATTLTITLSGPVGVPGVGARATALPVPANPGLLGLNLDFQGLFLDAGAVQGVSMSNAVAAWIG